MALCIGTSYPLVQLIRTFNTGYVIHKLYTTSYFTNHTFTHNPHTTPSPFLGTHVPIPLITLFFNATFCQQKHLLHPIHPPPFPLEWKTAPQRSSTKTYLSYILANSEQTTKQTSTGLSNALLIKAKLLELSLAN